jgi:hypothetical protein
LPIRNTLKRIEKDRLQGHRINEAGWIDEDKVGADKDNRIDLSICNNCDLQPGPGAA